MENIFLPIMQGKTVLVGIGNPLRGDDGFGPALIGRLQGKVKLICIDAGNSPENYLGRIIKEEPDTVLLVDVAHLDLEPGQYQILQPPEIMKCGLTTHDMSSRMLIDFLENETQANIFMLAVQPKNISLGEEMSECLGRTLDKIEILIQEGIHA